MKFRMPTNLKSAGTRLDKCITDTCSLAFLELEANREKSLPSTSPEWRGWWLRACAALPSALLRNSLNIKYGAQPQDL